MHQSERMLVSGLQTMAMPALKFELETPLEERVGRLEANVEHIQTDVSDIKIDIRRLGDKIDRVDQKLSDKIDGLDQRLSAKIDGIDQKIDGVDQKLSAKIDSVDQKLAAKIDSVDQKLSAKFDGIDQRFSAKTESLKDLVTNLAINMEKQFAKFEKSLAALHTARAFDRVWWLLMSGALLGIMARAFKWI
jgi:chromosome segregation ATPase